MNLLIVHNFYKSNNIGGEDLVVQAENKYLGLNQGLSNIHLFSVYNDRSNIIRMILAPIFPVITLLKLYFTIKKKNINVVHIHNYFPLISPFSFWIVKLSGVKLVHTLHNYRPWCLAGTFYRNNHGPCHKCIEKSPLSGVIHKCYKNSFKMSLYMTFLFMVYRKIGLFKLPDKIFILSNFQKKIVQSLNFFHQTLEIRQNILPGLVDDKYKNFNDKQHKAGYLFIGRIEESKGIEIVLNEWMKLPRNIHLTVIGNGPLLNQLRKSYNYSNITFLGKVEPMKVEKYIRESRFLIQSSIWYETMGLTIFEAFENKTPVIGFNIGTRLDFINHNKNGFLCNKFELSDRILKCELIEDKIYNDMCNHAYLSFRKYTDILDENLKKCYKFSEKAQNI
ncbi:glycosyltransferase [Amylibacter sp.]|nr:glycosyltransferase [Amylibacter sp.]